METQQYNTAIDKVLTFLDNHSWQNLRCSVGFDGYVDELYRVVEKREDLEHIQYYSNIESFGQRVIKASHKSADLELTLTKRKLGGNGPILSNALSEFGMQVTCIGTMGTNGGDNPFETMNPSCNRYSIGQASHTIALEFNDGKIMLGNLQGNYFNWQQIKDEVGLEKLQEIYRQSQMIAIVNWSGLCHIDEILEGYQNEVCNSISFEEQQKKIFFFDLADPSVLSENQLSRFIQLIRSYAKNSKVILGLNENETKKLGDFLFQDSQELEIIGKKLMKHLGVFQIVVHTNDHALAFSKEDIQIFEEMHVETPVISTGAGDHFNAGYLLGILGGLSLLDALILGQSGASYYLCTGISPTLPQLRDFIHKNMTSREEI